MRTGCTKCSCRWSTYSLGGAGGGAKDWNAADRLRDELASRGVAVRDTAAGQEWSPA